MALVLWEFSHNARKEMQSAVEDVKMTEDEVFDLVYNKFYELLEDHNINIDELII